LFAACRNLYDEQLPYRHTFSACAKQNAQRAGELAFTNRDENIGQLLVGAADAYPIFTLQSDATISSSIGATVGT
jgi:hypothetical protein